VGTCSGTRGYQELTLALLDELLVGQAPQGALVDMLGLTVDSSMSACARSSSQHAATANADTVFLVSELPRLLKTSAWASICQAVVERVTKLFLKDGESTPSRPIGWLQLLLSLRHTDRFSAIVDRKICMQVAKLVWEQCADGC
jgi:hypothetical protein